MKAIILDYTDASILILPIPKECEEYEADEFVRSHPCYDDSCCYHMVTSGDSFYVYNVVNDGNDSHDYVHIANL